ncbi:MAG: AtpZ/AtpI family protein [Melioribacteraceae bacterium]|nr:AtpZ/AtpI family protein [Melioribacteraceae bacterium]
MQQAGPYLGLGTQLAATIVAMFFLGRFLDEQLNTFPILILVFTFAGAAAGLYNFIKTVLELNEKRKKGK